ncbi:DUF305 domain-containing protein [Streptomyces sp. NPDC058417]|uniref:DUF305 domain-containing protein n=2 Tax=Streptomyces TaxID=1883 RepID=UPI00365EE89D
MAATAYTARSALVVAATLCALAVSGCSASPQDTGRAAAPPASAPAGSAGGAGAAVQGGLDTTAIGWLQLMIAMDDQARHLLELAPAQGADARLGTWATGLAARHRTDLTALRGMLADAGVRDDNPHKGHDMPGMVSTTELQDLEKARGKAFDTLLRAAMREHLVQAQNMATAVAGTGTGPKVKQLAAKVGESAAEAQRTLPAEGA